MERLTTKEKVVSGRDINKLLEPSNENQYGKVDAYFKLKEYEDLEEQGLLVRLPCKVGDTAYYVHRIYLKNADKWVDAIDEVIVDSFGLNIDLFVNVSVCVNGNRIGKTLTPYKTLFFTREEAEKALEG